MLKRGVQKKNLLFIFIAIFCLIASNLIDELRVYQGAQISTYIVAISSLILLTGYSGQVSLGQGAFLAVGGYAAAISKNIFHFPFPFAFIFAIIMASIAGAILGLAAARLSGPYLAGTTLALAVGIPSIANQFKILGGEQGLIFDVGMPPQILGDSFTQYKWLFWIALFFTLLAMWLMSNFLQSKFGRTFKSIRSNKVASELSGINSAKLQVLAFTISAGFAGLAGAMLCMTISTVSPSAFPLALSFSILTGAVLSGISTLPGVLLGAFTLVLVPELADSLAAHGNFSDRLVNNLPGFLISLLLVITVLFVPNGPIENIRRSRAKKGFNP